jgi:hypothetical protein
MLHVYPKTVSRDSSARFFDSIYFHRSTLYEAQNPRLKGFRLLFLIREANGFFRGFYAARLQRGFKISAVAYRSDFESPL